MEERRRTQLAVTTLGAALAGLGAGALGLVLGSGYGAVLGVALAMPLFVQLGWGFGGFDRDAYFSDLQLEDVVLDAGLIVTGASLLGTVAVAAVTSLGATRLIELAVATGAAFAGGGLAFLWQTEPYRRGWHGSDR